MPRPRRTKDHTGTAIGAAIGALVGVPFGAALPGAGLGGLLGSTANPEVPVALEEAMQEAVQRRGLGFVTLRRPSRLAAHVVFKAVSGSSYFSVKGFVAPRKGITPDEVDDALYDQLVSKLDQWVRTWRAER